MKKKTFTLILLLLFPLLAYTQTFVSTEPQNKNVVLEQYTGINCPACPAGATAANNIYNANPDRVVLIAVHAGGFANPHPGQPDFRTPFGPGLLGQTGITGFPAGTINRTVFPGMEMTTGGTGMGRNHWVNASNQILDQPAYLNVGAEAVIDLDTRELTVSVEVYYTDDSPVSTNKLNVVLLQDKTYAFQAGGGDNYEHNNRLVHMLSGQWGSDITTTTEGSLHEESFTYTIPADYNNILAELHNMRVAVFVAEDTQKVINGVQVSPSYLNVPDTDFAIVGHNIPESVWSGKITPEFSVLSMGETITSLDIEYYVNDEEIQTYNWTGEIEYGQTEVIILPELTFNLLPENTLYINILNEDSTPDDNSIAVNFTQAPFTGNGDLVVQVRTDQWGSETTWNIKNHEGTIVTDGGPYSNAVNTHNHDISLAPGYYILNVFDSYGDGILGGGYVRILDGDEILVNIPGNSFTSEASRLFSVLSPAIISFNPENGEGNVSNDATYTISSSKALLDQNHDPLTNDNVASVITLKENNADGDAIAFDAVVEDNSIITIDPTASIADGTIVYLAINAIDEDLVAINESVVFMVGANFTLTISAEANPIDGGSITGAGEYSYGEEVTLTATPDAGYHFVNWSENGYDIPDEDNVYVFNAYEDRHMVANFALTTYTATFIVKDTNNNNVDGATIVLGEITNSAGDYVFDELLPGSYAYTVSKEGFFDGTGSITITDEDVSETVTLVVDNTNISEIIEASISVYPNPAFNELFITLPEGVTDAEIRLYNQVGQLVFSEVAPGNTTSINVQNLTNGLYLLDVKGDNFHTNKKVMINK